MDDPDDTTPPSWDEHAHDLRGNQRALAMLRALLADDETELDASIAEVHELIELAAKTGDYSELEGFQAGMALTAIQFGRQLHGDLLGAVIQQQQADLAAHVADYNPDDEQQ